MDTSPLLTTTALDPPPPPHAELPPAPPPAPTAVTVICTGTENGDAASTSWSVTVFTHDTRGPGADPPPPGAAMDVTLTLRDAGSSPTVDCARRRPAADAGRHAPDTDASAVSLGMTSTPTAPRDPQVTMLVGTKDELDLTTNATWPTQSVLGSTATFMEEM